MRCFTGSLESDEHDHLRRAIGRSQRLPLAAEHVDQLFVHDPDHGLVGGKRLQDVLTDGALAHPGHEILDDLEVNVRLEQCPADFLHRVIDVFLGKLALFGQFTECFLQSI